MNIKLNINSYILILSFEITLILVSSCNEKFTINYNNEINTYQKYLQTDSLLYLSNSYNFLQQNPDYLKSGLNEKNKIIVVPILLNFKKFEELQLAINNSRDKNDTELRYISNKAYFLEFYQKGIIKDSFLIENIEIVNKKINETPNDTALYFDLIESYYLLNGYDSTMMFITSKFINDQKDENNDLPLQLKSALNSNAYYFKKNFGIK